jgi:integrase
MGCRAVTRRGGRCGELHRRVPQRLPARVEPAEVQALLGAARSARDRALLTLLWRTGQRIGDWSEEHGRHGVLGMRLADLDRASGTVVVCLKGARDEHRVPVSADFWPLYAAYVREERGLGAPEQPAWVACGAAGVGHSATRRLRRSCASWAGAPGCGRRRTCSATRWRRRWSTRRD